MSNSPPASTTSIQSDAVTPSRKTKQGPVETSLRFPFERNENAAKRFGFDCRNASARNLRYARESKKFSLGPMLARKFLDEFPPECEDGNMSKSEDAFKHVTKRAVKEQEIYNPLIMAQLLIREYFLGY
ncbi:hypothetical protein AcW1_008637 [Taiwanofungus camphoratus]|nr:hypothetical protein AcV5_006656 [Antrodia cinnamomea]KAI0948892.1 hypothetical protein AcW1_008637 [Antrodia cinnamomea]